MSTTLKTPSQKNNLYWIHSRVAKVPWHIESRKHKKDSNLQEAWDLQNVKIRKVFVTNYKILFKLIIIAQNCPRNYSSNALVVASKLHKQQTTLMTKQKKTNLNKQVPMLLV
jgi:hypothetical protein